ncbi:MAG: hypothetical protein J6W64_01735 [Bacilli bacterium]|nr:hypothetical protein [Bacilli bacterium]
MKEATGELNMTVITVVAIAAVGAFFYAFIWPRIKSNISKSTECSNAVCNNCRVTNGNRVCTGCTASDGTAIEGSCTYKETN